MIREPFRFRETFAAILAETPAHAAAAKEGMIAARQVLEGYIARDPFFASTFSPYEPDTDEPLIRHMARRCNCPGVGPMATVAGAIAAAGIDAMIGAGARFGVIDNGGDIALVSDREVRVGVHAGTAPLSGQNRLCRPAAKRTVWHLHIIGNGRPVHLVWDRRRGHDLRARPPDRRRVGNSSLQPDTHRMTGVSLSRSTPARCRASLRSWEKR